MVYGEYVQGERRWRDAQGQVCPGRSAGTLLLEPGPRNPTLPMAWLTWVQLRDDVSLSPAVQERGLAWSDGQSRMLRPSVPGAHTLLVEWSWV